MRTRGFTLLETMVVIGILALLLGLGIPSFNYFKSNQGLRSTADTMLSDVRNARQLAQSGSDGSIFVGPVPGNQPGNGNVQVEVFTVANGVASVLEQETTIQQQFAAGCQNVPTASQILAMQVKIGAFVVFSGPSAQHVLGFQANGAPVLPAGSGVGQGSDGLSGCGIKLANSAMTVDVIVTTLGDVSSVQAGLPGLPATQTAILESAATAF